MFLSGRGAERRRSELVALRVEDLTEVMSVNVVEIRV
jgi:hypothetical protein